MDNIGGTVTNFDPWLYDGTNVWTDNSFRMGPFQTRSYPPPFAAAFGNGSAWVKLLAEMWDCNHADHEPSGPVRGGCHLYSVGEPLEMEDAIRDNSGYDIYTTDNTGSDITYPGVPTTGRLGVYQDDPQITWTSSSLEEDNVCDGL